MGARWVGQGRRSVGQWGVRPGVATWVLSRAILFGTILTGTILSGTTWGQGAASSPQLHLPADRIPAENLQEYSDLAVKWMQEYLRVDTTNPPGNEMRAVEFYRKILDQEGIENRVAGGSLGSAAGQGCRNEFPRLPKSGRPFGKLRAGRGAPPAYYSAEPYGCRYQRCCALESSAV